MIPSVEGTIPAVTPNQGQNSIKQPMKSEPVKKTLSVRPKVAGLLYRIYDKPIHPEFYRSLAQKRLTRAGWTLTLSITGVGHVLELAFGDRTLTEITTASSHELPGGAIFETGFRAEQSWKTTLFGNIPYETTFQREYFESPLFQTIQEELTRSDREGLSYCFEAGCRVPTRAVSYLSTMTRDRKITVRAFHTFPENNLIVRVVSRVELPE